MTTDAPPGYSLPAMIKVREKVRTLILETLALSNAPFADVRVFRTVCEGIERKVIRRPGDYTPSVPPDNSDYFEQKEELEAWKQKRIEVISELLDGLRENNLNAETLKEIGIIISGCLETIKEGVMPEAWDHTKPTWACLIVKDVVRTRARNRKLYKVVVRSIGGITSGGTWNLHLVGSYLQKIMRAAGLPKYDAYMDEDIGGLCFTSQILVNQGRLVFTNVGFSSSQKTHNTRLIKQRKQICRGPFEPYRGRQECRYCPVGQDACPISRSSESFSVKRACTNNHMGFFRESEPEEQACIGCRISGKFGNPRKEQ